jgi:hypothetical protein
LVILLGRVAPFLAGSSLVSAIIVGLLAAVVMLEELVSVVIILVLVGTLLVQGGPPIDWSALSLRGATPATLSVGAVVALTAFVALRVRLLSGWKPAGRMLRIHGRSSGR